MKGDAMSVVKDQEALNNRIKEEITKNPIVLYMKGDRSFPHCGFSARVVEILEKLGVSYETHDVLSDPELRFGMKNFSNWPTFPQLFVKGELIGGSDIVSSLFNSGELQNLLKEKQLLA
jgi:monothiol glutaredoxin